VNTEEPTRLAGALLTLARRRAGLTQTELAHRAGVQQSVVSAYESGRRQPTIPTLLRLVRAAGNDVRVTLAGDTAQDSAGEGSEAESSTVRSSAPDAPGDAPGAASGRSANPATMSARHMQLGRSLRRERRAVLDTAARHGAGNVRIFGSVARGDDRPGSDVDLLVDLDADRGLLDLIGLRQSLEDLLGAKVDVVPAADLHSSIKERAGREAIPL
jgi:predicted nucleotidyltransferase/DNA-binding XRE family transcriptional regulator